MDTSTGAGEPDDTGVAQPAVPAGSETAAGGAAQPPRPIVVEHGAADAADAADRSSRSATPTATAPGPSPSPGLDAAVAARGLTAAAQLAMGLPAVVHDYPAAVLLIDTTSSQVVYANDLATQLTPTTTLPADVQNWSAAARLQVIGGGALGDSSTPLAQVAIGNPEAGRQVSAALATQASTAREALWMIGLPLSGAPGLLRQRSLVVLLPVRFPQAVTSIQDAAAHARGIRSVLVSDLSMSISDARSPDDPLVWVSEGFSRVTGYTREQVIGRNCRFLQGPDTDPEVLARIRTALACGDTVSETLLNYRADGSAFFNHLLISPVREADGSVIHHVAVQTDVTQRVLAEGDRELARTSVSTARDAQAVAEADGAFDQLLLSLSEALAATATVEDVAATVARVAATVGATGSVLGLPARSGTQMRMTSMANLPADTDPAWAQVALHEDSPMTAAARSGQATFFENLQAALSAHPAMAQVAGLPQVGATAQLPLVLSDPAAARFASPPQRDHLLDVRPPIQTGGQSGGQSGGQGVGRLGVIGVAGLTWPGPRTFTSREQAALQALGRYAAQALQRALLAAERRHAAHLLQESLLTRLPVVDGLELAASYVPTASEEHVGGDWYDALVLPDGAVVVVIGDVTGHDIAAAARMGQMRGMLRAFAYDRQEPPVDIVTRLDRALPGLGVEGLATLVLGRIEAIPGPDGAGTAVAASGSEPEGHRLSWTNAGHLPPLLLAGDGAVTALERPSELLVGLDPATSRSTHEAHLPPGSTLVLYTDGLVERRGRSISEGIQALEALLSRHHRLPLQELVDQVHAELVGTTPDDDCALLLVRTPTAPAGAVPQ